VIILDDFFNEAWPGVSTGTAQFLRDNPKVIVPFAILGKCSLRGPAKWRGSTDRAMAGAHDGMNDFRLIRYGEGQRLHPADARAIHR
jgi:hypothetical protein